MDLLGNSMRIDLRFYVANLYVDCKHPDNIRIAHRLMFDRFWLNIYARSYEQIPHFHIQHKQNQL